MSTDAKLQRYVETIKATGLFTKYTRTPGCLAWLRDGKYVLAIAITLNGEIETGWYTRRSSSGTLPKRWVNISFEEVFNSVDTDTRKDLAFHLDLFQ